MISALDVGFLGPTVSSLGAGTVVRPRLQVMTLAGKYAAPVLLPRGLIRSGLALPSIFRS